MELTISCEPSWSPPRLLPPPVLLPPGRRLPGHGPAPPDQDPPVDVGGGVGHRPHLDEAIGEAVSGGHHLVALLIPVDIFILK